MKQLNLMKATIAAAALFGTALSTPAMAQEKFPAKDITFVVQAAAGGASDRTSRGFFIP